MVIMQRISYYLVYCKCSMGTEKFNDHSKAVVLLWLSVACFKGQSR